MKIDETQKIAVTNWIQSGKNLAEVQGLLSDEFNISMTYMDVRFMVDDLDIYMEESKDKNDQEKCSNSDEDKEVDVETPELLDEDPATLPSSVSIELDGIVRPGALISGTVRFKNAKKLSWQLDDAGQLGIIPGAESDYRPEAEEIQEFQIELEKILREKGF